MNMKANLMLRRASAALSQKNNKCRSDIIRSLRDLTLKLLDNPRHDDDEDDHDDDTDDDSNDSQSGEFEQAGRQMLAQLSGVPDVPVPVVMPAIENGTEDACEKPALENGMAACEKLAIENGAENACEKPASKCSSKPATQCSASLHELTEHDAFAKQKLACLLDLQMRKLKNLQSTVHAVQGT